MQITAVEARQILDTRTKATVETTLTAGTLSVTASVPSGKSTGSHEALELRDADGSVTHATEHVNSEIARAIIGREFASPDEVDACLIELDGTPHKSRLGANAILSVSIAAQRLFAQAEGVPLWRAIASRIGIVPGSPSEQKSPRLFVNVMNGGAHADFKLPFQEYILVVEGSMGTAFPIVQEAFAKIGERLGSNTPMGDEGGYAPTFSLLEEPFELLADIVAEFPGTAIAIDAAATEFYRDNAYQLLDKQYTANELSEVYENLVSRFPIYSIEDPFAENAHDDFARLTAALGEKILIVGDDLTVTDPARILDAASRREINTVLIKPNQIGTVREAIRAVQQTYASGFKAIASHRSGETDDTFITDFAYGVGAHGIKAGGLGQLARVQKYDRLRAIEREAETM